MSGLESLPRRCLILKIIKFSGCCSFHLKSLLSTCVSAAGHSRGTQVLQSTGGIPAWNLLERKKEGSTQSKIKGEGHTSG